MIPINCKIFLEDKPETELSLLSKIIEFEIDFSLSKYGDFLNKENIS